MDEYVIPIVIAVLLVAVVVMTMWALPDETEDAIVTRWGMVRRAESPTAYTFLAWWGLGVALLSVAMIVVALLTFAVIIFLYYDG